MRSGASLVAAHQPVHAGLACQRRAADEHGVAGLVVPVVADHALANGKTFCLILSAPFIVDFFAYQVATALLYADYLFCNEGEAAAYGKKHGYGEDLKEVALKIASSEKKDPSTIAKT